MFTDSLSTSPVLYDCAIDGICSIPDLKVVNIFIVTMVAIQCICVCFTKL